VFYLINPIATILTPFVIEKQPISAWIPDIFQIPGWQKFGERLSMVWQYGEVTSLFFYQAISVHIQGN